MMPRIGRRCAGQRNQCAEQRNAADKGLRAVDRIQHPDEFGIVAGAAELFPDDAVLREPVLDQRSHGLFRRPVGRGHRRQIRLVVDRERLAKIWPDHLARRIGQAQRERKKFVDFARWH